MDGGQRGAEEYIYTIITMLLSLRSAPPSSFSPRYLNFSGVAAVSLRGRRTPRVTGSSCLGVREKKGENFFFCASESSPESIRQFRALPSSGVNWGFQENLRTSTQVFYRGNLRPLFVTNFFLYLAETIAIDTYRSKLNLCWRNQFTLHFLISHFWHARGTPRPTSHVTGSVSG